MTDAELASTIERLRDNYLLPAADAAASQDRAPAEAVALALCQSAITSCAALAGGDMQAAAEYYRPFRDESEKLFWFVASWHVYDHG